jgi:multifunctional methyltransferase subunit TRM112
MRLITHNMLRCNVKGVVNGYPLKISADEVEISESDNPFSLEFMQGLLRKLDLAALKSAAADLGMEGMEDLNVEDKAAVSGDIALLERMYHLLFEVHVETGRLTCPESGREFGIESGIPNMLLHEDEV